MNRFLFLCIIAIMAFVSCKDEQGHDEDDYGKLSFHFDFRVDGETLQVDTVKYLNEAGNQYLISEIQYFVSDVILYKDDGSTYLIDEWKDMHYIDSDIEETWTWDVFDEITIGTYDSISFTFGISEEKNQSLMFVNPPKSYMFWPENLGGGYHYMKLNGKWINPDGNLQPYNFHLGIGQIYENYPDDIIEFIHNDFNVSLASSGFTLAKGEKKAFMMTMNIENWFKNPIIYDHNIWQGDIMQKQDAMREACINGHDVFSIQINE